MEGGDTWVLGPSVSEDPGALQEGAKRTASLAGFPPKLLDPAGASPKARAFSRCSLQICGRANTITFIGKFTIIGKVGKGAEACPQMHPAIDADRQKPPKDHNPDPSSR